MPNTEHIYNKVACSCFIIYIKKVSLEPSNTSIYYS